MGGFDTKKFLKTRFSDRMQDVPVPRLQVFFPEGEKPVWKVRGLTGQEIGVSRAAVEGRKDKSAIMDGLLGSVSTEKAKAIRQIMNLNGELEEDVVRRISQVAIASVEPKCSEELVVALCENFPVEFYLISNTILALTGLGREPGKSLPSGKTPESESA